MQGAPDARVDPEASFHKNVSLSALKLLQRGKMDRAIERYQTLLRDDPRDRRIRQQIVVVPGPSVSDETAATGVSDDAKQTVDSLLENLGEFGPFQRILYFALWFPAASMAVGVYASVYMEYTPEYHCAVNSEEYNPKFSKNGKIFKI